MATAVEAAQNEATDKQTDQKQTESANVAAPMGET